MVAPRAGAWIETLNTIDDSFAQWVSHPVRVRGLKPPTRYNTHSTSPVASRAGAWIETNDAGWDFASIEVAPRAGAWIETILALIPSPCHPSHPVRVRGLKHQHRQAGYHQPGSHPVRVRGLKHKNPEC